MMNEEGFLRLFEAMMEQAYEDASYKGTNEKRLEEKKRCNLIYWKNEKRFCKLKKRMEENKRFSSFFCFFVLKYLNIY